MQEFSSVLHPADWRYNLIFTILVMFFAFFYTSVVFNPVDVADNLKKSGGFVPGIRPGKNTAAYIERVLSRITFAGALYLVGRVHDPGAAPEVLPGAVPVRRHGPPDRRRCRARYRAADRVAPHHAQLRRLRRPKGPRIRGRVAARPRGACDRELRSVRRADPSQVARTRFASCARRVCRGRDPRGHLRGGQAGRLDLGARQIARAGSTSTRSSRAFLGYHGYPAVLCTSINEVVVHGIPRKNEILKDGDIIGIDFGIFKHGFCADTARTVMIGNVSDEKQKLVDDRPRGARERASSCAGRATGSATSATRSRRYAESHGYSVVRQFVGHGTGRQMHEDPQVPNFGEGRRQRETHENRSCHRRRTHGKRRDP